MDGHFLLLDGWMIGWFIDLWFYCFIDLLVYGFIGLLTYCFIDLLFYWFTVLRDSTKIKHSR